MPLPHLRAFLTLTYAAAALLAAGGMLEYATGSPATAGQGRVLYWFLVFAFNLTAFGGAALVGGFPRLARPTIKWTWGILLIAVYALTFAVWRYYDTVDSGGAIVSQWLFQSRVYLPSVVPVFTGLLWSRLPENNQDVESKRVRDDTGGRNEQRCGEADLEE